MCDLSGVVDKSIGYDRVEDHLFGVFVETNEPLNRFHRLRLRVPGWIGFAGLPPIICIILPKMRIAALIEHLNTTTMLVIPFQNRAIGQLPATSFLD